MTETASRATARPRDVRSDDRNKHGVAEAMTNLTAIRPRWRRWLGAVFWLTERVPLVTKELRQLSFIHFCRWVIIDEIPYNGPPQEREDLRYSRLLFESNFNGTWDQYIDAFGGVVAPQMLAIWGPTFGTPPPKPVGPLKAVIANNSYPAGHYYSAYPEATTTVVQSALDLHREAEDLIASSASLNAHDFADAYNAFLTRMQRHL